MPVVYVKEQGAYVKKEGERIVIQKDKQELAEIAIRNVTNLSIIGNVQVTTPVIHKMLENGIDISYFTYSGKYLGQISSDSSKNVFLRFAQYELYQDLESRLNVARIIVANKINNQIKVLDQYRWEEGNERPSREISDMKDYIESLQEKKTSNEIMGVEGICSSIYFSIYGRMFRSKIRFVNRNRRPPKDPINIILSLAYTLLTKEVAAALESESFETYLGFLHGIRYGRRSLALDIVEEFRQPVVDRLTLLLFNKQILSEFDFVQDEDRMSLTEEGFHKFCLQYEKWMKQPISKADGRSFRSVIRNQAAKLKLAIRNKVDYEPYAWKEDREDVCSDI